MEVPQIQFIDDVAPRREQFRRLHRCSSLNKVVLCCCGEVRIDKVVDVPVVIRRRPLHASSTKAFGREFLHILRAVPTSLEIWDIISMSSLFWQSPADSCDSPQEAFGRISQYFPVERWDGGLESLRSILGLPALFAQRNLDNISSAARETVFFGKSDAYA